jgi:hypothetical protein
MEGRKPRHAAALALVGWYLMTPPLKTGGPDNDAPRSRWNIEHVFDSAADCDRVMTQWHRRATRLFEAIGNKKKRLDPPDQEVTIEQLYGLANCDCIATDDPRLKEK